MAFTAAIPAWIRLAPTAPATTPARLIQLAVCAGTFFFSVFVTAKEEIQDHCDADGRQGTVEDIQPSCEVIV